MPRRRASWATRPPTVVRCVARESQAHNRQGSPTRAKCPYVVPTRWHVGPLSASFNSPSASFVLPSTSVGQEGIDFHWWSHAVVRWNLPSNPVDFEQREGRVNRFADHAIRKNVAQAHWADVLAGEGTSPWRTAFEAARSRAAASTDLGEFAPWWVYPGDARIQRVLANYPLSRDEARYERPSTIVRIYVQNVEDCGVRSRLNHRRRRPAGAESALARRGPDRHSSR